MIIFCFLVLLGLLLLYLGGEGFVKGATSIAKRTSIPEYAIGATVVALGTSLPELVTGVYAAYTSRTDISVSNVVGSNIFNIGFALGVSAAFFGVKTERQIFHIDIPPLMVSIILLFLLSADGVISKFDGILLLFSFIAFTVRLLRDRETVSIDEFQDTTYSIPIAFLVIVVSGFLLHMGAKWLVEGGVGIAHSLGISEWIIGSTVIAIGTSSPEFFTSFAALRHGNDELAIGNVIGSNITNVFLVLGASAIVRPLAVSQIALHFDFTGMFLFSLLLAFMISDRRVSRESGVWLVLLMLAYIIGMVRLH